MNILKLFAASTLVTALQVHAQPAACPDEALLEQLLSFGDLFLGEIHGTVETPKLVQCLVERALQNPGEPVIVSVEQSELARDAGSPIWKHDDSGREDGRSSEAMFALVMDLVDKEREGLIKLHFQHGGLSRPSAEAIGLELKDLSERGLVIALAGGAHSMKNVPAGSPLAVLQEGPHVGPNFTHINIGTAGGGSFWACVPIAENTEPQCGVRQTAPRSATAGALVPDATTGHDYVLYLERFTASPPMNRTSQ